MASPQQVGLFTIPISTSDSNVLTSDDFGRAQSLSISSLDAALTGVCTLMCNSKKDGSGTWTTVQSPPGTDSAIAALKSIVLGAVPFLALKIHSAAVEAAARTFMAIGAIQN